MSSETAQKVFVNHINSFIGKYLVKNISEYKSNEDLEDEENKDQDSGFVVIGTVSELKENVKSNALSILSSSDSNFLNELKKCSFIIYNILDDVNQITEAQSVINGLVKSIEDLPHTIDFILISTVMTWAKTKLLETDDTELTLNDDDFRRRKHHTLFQNHIELEKEVSKAGTINKKKLKTHVIACGIVYGYEETVFHNWFKKAWNNESPLLVYGKGNNIIPTIHVKDICSTVTSVMTKSPKKSYIIACDESNLDILSIIKAISLKLGNGSILKVPFEDIYTTAEMEEMECAMMSLDLRIDALYAHDNLDFEWHSDGGMLENMSLLIKEFKISRKLIPMKVCILGPPGAGKTTIASHLKSYYKLHLVNSDVVLEEYLKNAEDILKRNMSDEMEEETREFEDDNPFDEEFYNQIKEQLELDGFVDDDTYSRLFKNKLLSNECQNQGFILDDWPKTMDQAMTLFSLSEGDEDEDDQGKEDDLEEDDDEDPNKPVYNKKTMPEIVVLLEADDEFLIERIINMPEELVQQMGDKYTEEGFQSRLAKYRMMNTEELCVSNYFDMKDIHPVVIDTTKDTSEFYKLSIKHIINLLGEPRNYGLSNEEVEARKAQEEEERKQEFEKLRELERKEAEAEQEMAAKYQQEWEKRILEIKNQEEELLENESLPLRNYLMKYIMPTLTKGLLEVTNVRPDDPIDYLAEFLFKQTTI